MSREMETDLTLTAKDTLERANAELRAAVERLTARLEGAEAQPTCWCYARAAADGPCPVCVNADLRAQLAATRERIATLETELDVNRMAYRHGTPFDPTGVKNALEIRGLRTSLEQAEARVRTLRQERDAYWEYTYHRPACASFPASDDPCTCGYDSLAEPSVTVAPATDRSAVMAERERIKLIILQAENDHNAQCLKVIYDDGPTHFARGDCRREDHIADAVVAAASDADGVAITRGCQEALQRAEQAETRERALREALGNLFALVEDGSLVRNTVNDGHLPSFIAETTRLVNALATAKELLAPAADQSGS